MRKSPKRVDYLLRYTRDFPIAVVEAKASYHQAADGLQQAKGYAEMLRLQFAYATNGREIIEFDYATGIETTLAAFPKPDELWRRYRQARGLEDSAADRLLTPANRTVGQGDRYYQRIAINSIVEAVLKGERRTGLFREFAPDFFDLVIVDECHRGSARDDSTRRTILEHFEPAVQLGMTATPLRDDNVDTYRYFGNPVYEYSLRQGIDDGFLAPYRVHRVITEWDAAGWRPSRDDLDRYGRPIPDDEYQTPEFERVVALRARTEAIARHLTHFLRKSNRFAKTIVFCVDQEHASEMRRALSNLNRDVVAKHPDYVCRVTADEGDIGRGHLSRFQDVDTRTPVILTTSKLLTTGIDAPTCGNIVIARVVGSMSEFKQIIGRGTRVRDDYGKLWFNIIDYTCVPKPGVVTAPFLCFYFLTDEGLGQLGEASPGGAGRNRTLGLNALGGIQVPVIPYEKQLWFDKLQACAAAIAQRRNEIAAQLDALLPSILHRAFNGEF